MPTTAIGIGVSISEIPGACGQKHESLNLAAVQRVSVLRIARLDALRQFFRQINVKNVVEPWEFNTSIQTYLNHSTHVNNSIVPSFR